MVNYQRIESYILDKLPDQEIENLWMAFIRDPELYDYFEIELMLRTKSVTKKIKKPVGK